MKQQKWMSRLVAGSLVTISLAGVALAASQGSQSDPLVTLSYLNDKATPAIMAQVDAKVSQREAALKGQLDQAVAGYVKEVEGKLSGSTGGGTSSSYQVVTLTKGQKLVAGVSCEILLRSGAATCVSESSPGLVDMTSGSTLSPGGSLVANHLYLATIAGRGVKATSAVTLMVRGSYSVQS